MFSECWLDVNQQWKNSTDGFILPFVFAQLLLTEETNSDKFKFYVKISFSAHFSHRIW